MPNQFDTFSPFDHWGLTTSELVGMYFGVNLVFREGGQISDARPRSLIWEVDAGSPEIRVYGEFYRVKLLAEALCRYFNTGGDWEELDQVVANVREVVSGGIVVPGWEYLYGEIDGDAHFRHIWMDRQSGRAVCWVEQEYIDTGWTAGTLSAAFPELTNLLATYQSFHGIDYEQESPPALPGGGGSGAPPAAEADADGLAGGDPFQ